MLTTFSSLYAGHIDSDDMTLPGLEAVSVQSSMGTPEPVLIEQLERFAAEVVPAFDVERGRSSAA